MMDLPQFIAKRSLSTKLLLLTIVFVFIAELLVLIPSIANERMEWLEMRLEEAYLVSLALEGASDQMIEEETARQLFGTANILGVTVNRANLRILILAPEIDPHGPPRMHRVDLRDRMALTLILNGWGTLFSKGDDMIRVTGAPRFAMDQPVDIIVSQKALREDLRAYAGNIFVLSLIISSITAGLVYGALNLMIIRPVKRVTHNMAAFAGDPDSAALIHTPSTRKDEIGVAERGLKAMQQRLHEMLDERRRLAALGAGISKLSHDLRNILASAQLMSDRLAQSEDARVRKLSPRLISSLDRAIILSRDTLAFGRMEPGILDKAPVGLHDLAQEALDDVAHQAIAAENRTPSGLTVIADRTHLYRALFNLLRNAIDAMTDGAEEGQIKGSIAIEAEEAKDNVFIRIIDTGPGIPEYAQAALFEPFKGSKKPGGSGLGLAIAAEIIAAHKGELFLERTDRDGTTFRIELPHNQKS